MKETDSHRGLYRPEDAKDTCEKLELGFDAKGVKDRDGNVRAPGGIRQAGPRLRFGPAALQRATTEAPDAAARWRDRGRRSS